MRLSAIVSAGGFEKFPDMIINCLRTLRFCDEIILINFSGKPIDDLLPKGLKIQLVPASFQSSFAKLRDLGANQAKGDWLLYLDLDERVTPKLSQEIKTVIDSPLQDRKYSRSQSEPNLEGIVAYQISRKNYYLGKKFKHAGAWPDHVIRLIKKDALVEWQGIIHEQPVIKGEIGQLKNPIIHLTHRNISEMVEKTLNWSQLEAALRLQAGHPEITSWRFWRIMLTAFWDNFIKNKACFEGTEGVIEGLFQMFSIFITYVRLWEAQQKPSLPEKYQQIDKEIISSWRK